MRVVGQEHISGLCLEARVGDIKSEKGVAGNRRDGGRRLYRHLKGEEEHAFWSQDSRTWEKLPGRVGI